MGERISGGHEISEGHRAWHPENVVMKWKVRRVEDRTNRSNRTYRTYVEAEVPGLCWV